MHRPFAHAPEVQTVPHEPQLFASSSRFAQVPLQTVVSAGHAHMPDEQLRLPPQPC